MDPLVRQPGRNLLKQVKSLWVWAQAYSWDEKRQLQFTVTLLGSGMSDFQLHWTLQHHICSIQNNSYRWEVKYNGNKQASVTRASVFLQTSLKQTNKIENAAHNTWELSLEHPGWTPDLSSFMHYVASSGRTNLLCMSRYPLLCTQETSAK